MFLKEAIGKNLTFKNAKKNYVLVPYLLIFIEFFSYFKRKNRRCWQSECMCREFLKLYTIYFLGMLKSHSAVNQSFPQTKQQSH